MAESRRNRSRKSGALPEFDTVLPKTRRAQVAETLRNFVLGGRIEPGTQLIESKLATSLGVSRSSIREAIWELIDQGLLVNRPYAGTFVVSVDEKTMIDLFSLRGAPPPPPLPSLVSCMLCKHIAVHSSNGATGL